MPEKFGLLLGNLSTTFSKAGKTVVVDVASDWAGNIGGPDHLESYAQHAPTIRFMDMGSYYAGEADAPRLVFNNLALARLLPRPMLAPGIGLVEIPGHENASCGGWPDGHQCTNLSDPACGCIDYRWSQATLHDFITQAEQLGVQEIDVWRMDLDIPPGTVPSVPPWFVAELTGFLSRGEDPLPPPPPLPVDPPLYLGGGKGSVSQDLDWSAEPNWSAIRGAMRGGARISKGIGKTGCIRSAATRASIAGAERTDRLAPIAAQGVSVGRGKKG
eukprot:SAG11_NODE_4355_length_1935_cov_0.935185_2_plen_273_part_00